MRTMLALVVALATVAAVGCYHDKHNLAGPKREDYELPPDEARYNLPDTAPYKPPPVKKQQDNLSNRGGGNSPVGGGLGGF
jgi:hypothetical protein